MREKYDALKAVMNAHIDTSPTDLGLSPALALVDANSSPYLAAVDTLRLITDVVSPSAKLNIIGIIAIIYFTPRAGSGAVSK